MFIQDYDNDLEHNLQGQQQDVEDDVVDEALPLLLDHVEGRQADEEY